MTTKVMVFVTDEGNHPVKIIAQRKVGPNAWESLESYTMTKGGQYLEFYVYDSQRIIVEEMEPVQNAKP